MDDGSAVVLRTGHVMAVHEVTDIDTAVNGEEMGGRFDLKNLISVALKERD